MLRAWWSSSGFSKGDMKREVKLAATQETGILLWCEEMMRGRGLA